MDLTKINSVSPDKIDLISDEEFLKHKEKFIDLIKLINYMPMSQELAEKSFEIAEKLYNDLSQ